MSLQDWSPKNEALQVADVSTIRAPSSAVGVLQVVRSTPLSIPSDLSTWVAADAFDGVVQGSLASEFDAASGVFTVARKCILTMSACSVWPDDSTVAHKTQIVHTRGASQVGIYTDAFGTGVSGEKTQVSTASILAEPGDTLYIEISQTNGGAAVVDVSSVVFAVSIINYL